jgi:glycosyltransferase involved in cell wall biosynthesis
MSRELEKIKLSIVTVSYNQAPFIERTIESVLGQDYKNVEYIIIDGGSTDGSVEIIKRYESRLAYWKSEKDDGQVDGINKGLRLVTGDWVAFQNSDDIYYPGYFQRVVDAIMADTDLGLIYSNINHIDTDDNVLDFQMNLYAHRWLQLMTPQIHNQVAFWRKDLMDKTGLLEPRYAFGFDYDYFVRLLLTGCSHRRLNTTGGGFRIHDLSRTVNENGLCRKDIDDIRKEHGGPVVSNIPSWIGRNIAKVYKTAWCMTHGEVGYLIRKRSKVLSRIKFS